MHERRFQHDLGHLRDPQRIANLELQRVASLSLANLSQARNLLDLGTGTGVFAEEFTRRGLKATGLDADPQALLLARQYVPRASFVLGSAEALPFKSGAFSLVFMGLLLHETDDRLAALRQALRVAESRVVILEWPAEEQPFGPPLADRLSAQEIQDLAQKGGARSVQTIPLTRRILYLVEP